MSDKEKIESEIGLLEQSVKDRILRIVLSARKEGYTLGFNTAKKVYSRKLINRKEAYSDILTGYRQSTGISDDLFTKFLEEKGELL